MAPWVPLVVNVLLFVVSLFAGLLAWVLRSEVKKTEKANEELKSTIQSQMLRLEGEIDDLHETIKEERKERIRVTEQLFSRANATIDKISGLDTTISSHRNDCMQIFVTSKEFERVEQTRLRQEKSQYQEYERLERNLSTLVSYLDSIANRKKMT